MPPCFIIAPFAPLWPSEKRKPYENEAVRRRPDPRSLPAPCAADVVFADPPHWKQLHEGETAYLNRDYRRALQILLPLADNGDYTVRSIVQPKLAQIYVLGPEGVKNPAEAARWLHKAAEGGDIGSQYYLGAALSARPRQGFRHQTRRQRRRPNGLPKPQSRDTPTPH